MASAGGATLPGSARGPRLGAKRLQLASQEVARRSRRQTLEISTGTRCGYLFHDAGDLGRVLRKRSAPTTASGLQAVFPA